MRAKIVAGVEPGKWRQVNVDGSDHEVARALREASARARTKYCDEVLLVDGRGGLLRIIVETAEHPDVTDAKQAVDSAEVLRGSVCRVVGILIAAEKGFSKRDADLIQATLLSEAKRLGLKVRNIKLMRARQSVKLRIDEREITVRVS